MADPTITSAVLNKASYAPGETMILTVQGADLDEEQIEVTVSLRNTASGGTSAPATVTATIDELEAVASDTGERTWTQTGRVGDTFTLTATA